MQMLKSVTGSKSKALYSVLILLLLSTLALLNAIFTGLESQNRIRSYSATVEQLSEVIGGNVRTLAMVQRELLRLMVLLEADVRDSERLELQRSFAAQRLREATVDVQRMTLGSEELFQQNLALVAIWMEDINPRMLAYIANPQASLAERDELLEDIRQLELEFNQITAYAEINREYESSQLQYVAEDLLNNIENLISALLFTLIGFVSLTLISSGIFGQFVRIRAESTSQIISLLHETKKLSQVASRISNLVVMTNRYGVIEWVNDAFVQRSGFLPDELIGQRLDLWLQDLRVAQQWRNAIQNGKGFTTETNARTKSGEGYSILVGVQPSYDDSGQLTHFIIVQTDITEMKKVESALRLSENQLKDSLIQERELNQIKSRFVSMTSHEFRTPIAIISAAAESLRDFYERMNEDQRKSRFERIQEQINHMTHMLDDILLINRIEEGKLSLNLEMFSLNSFMHSIIEEFKSTRTPHNIDYQEHTDNLSIIADRTLVRQIMTNLISNAIKYSPGHSTVTIILDRKDDHAVMRVRDEGIGIPLADQPLMFEAFHRADNVGKIKGTGLGLSITKRAVDMHKGVISFTSEDNKGSEFMVQLPLKQRYLAGITKPLAVTVNDETTI
jgi:PAS domain S-box-containing protein